MSESDTSVAAFTAARGTRRAAMLSEYRSLVEAIASGEKTVAEFGERLDQLMERLSISDADLSNDVDAVREYRALGESIAAFAKSKPQHDARLVQLTDTVRSAKETFFTAERQFQQAQRDRRLAGKVHNQDRDHRKQQAQIESESPRLFGEIGRG